jgi:TetR/AcrR family transcriptional repressor of nem operon
MPYPPGHRDETRKKIVDSARRLFNRHGFENVSVRQIMAGAGLTHGGFYSYFASKSDLYAEALTCFFTDPDWKYHWKSVEVDPKAADLEAQIVRAYLSRQHFEDMDNSCPLVALPTDMARSGKTVRKTFEGVFAAMVAILERSLSGDRRVRKTTARAIAALCVGGMVVARGMADRVAADGVRDACRAVALELGSWEGEIESTKTVSRGQRANRSIEHALSADEMRVPIRGRTSVKRK